MKNQDSNKSRIKKIKNSKKPEKRKSRKSRNQKSRIKKNQVSRKSRKPKINKNQENKKKIRNQDLSSIYFYFSFHASSFPVLLFNLKNLSKYSYNLSEIKSKRPRIWLDKSPISPDSEAKTLKAGHT